MLQSITTGYVVDDTVLGRISAPFALVIGSADQDHEQSAGQLDTDSGEWQFRGGVHDCTKLTIGQFNSPVLVISLKRHLEVEVPNPKKCFAGVGVKTI